MDWLRWYHGTVTDPKFRVVAKKAASEIEGLRVSDVLAVWGMLLERASASEPRGSFAGFDSEAADATFYNFDFVAVRPDCFELHEVKGHWEDDARVKWKTAAETFWWFKFFAAMYVKGTWEIEEYRG